MNCPYCTFVFKALAVVGGALPDLAPIVCEQCAEVSLLDGGRVRTLEVYELEELKKSPAWREVVEPIQKIVRDHHARTSN